TLTGRSERQRRMNNIPGYETNTPNCSSLHTRKRGLARGLPIVLLSINGNSKIILRLSVKTAKDP
ncbi:hypothetical protein L9F63_008329, partial [Diploptera punctata]